MQSFPVLVSSPDTRRRLSRKASNIKPKEKNKYVTHEQRGFPLTTPRGSRQKAKNTFYALVYSISEFKRLDYGLHMFSIQSVQEQIQLSPSVSLFGFFSSLRTTVLRLVSRHPFIAQKKPCHRADDASAFHSEVDELGTALLTADEVIQGFHHFKRKYFRQQKMILCSTCS